MRIVMAGGHGKIALLLAELLTGRGHSVAALIRNPGHAPEVYAVGAEPVVIDLERADVADLAATVQGSDAVIFAAGAGPGSTAARKYTVDRDGSVLLADAAEASGVRRFLQISTMGAGLPPAPGRDEVWAAYIDAKTQAEDDLRARDLDWTILRPGVLTDYGATGKVTLAPPRLARGDIARADVAAVLAELLPARHTAGMTLELVGGDTPVAAAVAALER
ncbi:SDR family oxidoreductase [Nocardia cyriacigeorgica]|uniref:SDR family oxidoreductase n=1 Tax=Nocardia cyriacigeorgica TaxID=135487 RepID=A0A6P1DE70_9NOCA|nr:SDR family oxidoreductase [Nocardia cyriacigeorgica]NEW37923.1 SDR family oxidoreductase [Nocardia cyriacigeorgica]NEW47444.1 SDR family oxidoreductase [Nocardia cyriacigeorgica]NEW48694.1 SDR family oxidoreductase [Nocardia cyriacigeorgica]